MSDSNFDGVLDPDAAWPDIPQASTQFVVLGGQGGPLNEQAKALASRTNKLKSDIENISSAGFGGQYKNLVVTVSGVGYQGTITADRLVVESNDFKTKIIRNISVGFDGGNNGVNGLDINSIVTGNWYYIYVIYNQATDTVSTLLSRSSTPSLPSGYAHYAHVGFSRVLAATSAFVASIQKDNVVRYGTDQTVGSIQILTSGQSEGVTPVSTEIAVPPSAHGMMITVSGHTSGNTTLMDSMGVQAISQLGAQYYPYTVNIFSIDNSKVKYKVNSGSYPTNLFVTGYYL